MKKRRINLSKLLIAFALTVCLIGGGSQALAGDKPEEVLIGGITSLSGVAAPWGIGMNNIWQLAVDEINNGGTWWGKKGFTVKGKQYVWKLKTYDHAFNAAKAVSAANRLINRD